MSPRTRHVALAATLALLVALPLLPVGATDATTDAGPLQRALVYLAGTDLHHGQAAYATEAIAQAGLDAKTWPSASASVFSRLDEYAGSDGVEYSWLRVAHAAGTAGYDPRDVNGRDFTALVLQALEDGEAAGARFVNDEIWSILALRAAGFSADDARIQHAADKILAARAADGGWAYVVNPLSSETDVTGMALVALRAADRLSVNDERARLFLDGTKRDDGGHAVKSQSQYASSCQSTVWAIHGYRALGHATPEDAFAYLRGLQRDDGGFATSAGAPSDGQCTAEVIPLLAGAAAPFPGFALAELAAPATLAVGEPGAFRVDGPFARATWRFGDTEATGLAVSAAFSEPGTYVYALLAEGEGVRARVHGSLEVTGTLPRLVLAPPPAHAIRGAPIAVDARGSFDPDGRVVGLEVDWGDGNVTKHDALVAAHAYDAPGEREVRVRARDDAAQLSAPATFVVDVVNRAPVFEPFGTSAVVDRTAPYALPRATDPDGDGVTLGWTLGDRNGEGPAATLAGLPAGGHTLVALARDSFGAESSATVALEIVNLPPRLDAPRVPSDARAGETFAFSVNASDKDGPTPAVLWRFGDATFHGARGEHAASSAGAIDYEVVAMDADGATSRATGTLLVRDVDAPEPPAGAAPPRLRDVSARFEGDDLVVSFVSEPEGLRARVVWRSDAGDGATEAANGARIPLAGATEARVVVEVRTADGTASAEATTRRAAAPGTELAAPGLDLSDGDPVAGEIVRMRAAPPVEAERWRFDFGDGNVTPWSTAAEVVHAYDRPGLYEVRLETRDDAGRVSTTRGAVEVAPRPTPVERVDAGVVVLVPPPAAPPAPVDLVTRSSPLPASRPVPAPAWLALAAAALAPLLGHARRPR